MTILARLLVGGRCIPRPLAACVSLGLLSVPVLPLVHEAMVLAIAFALKTAASSLMVKQALMQAGLDPVYAAVFNRTMGNIEAKGLAVAGPLGDALHQMAPSFFASSDKVLPGAWATALVGDGVSVLASSIAMLGTEVIFIAGGLALLLSGLRRGRAEPKPLFLALALLGIMLQIRGLVGLVGLRFSIEDIEIMGLSHVFTKLFPMDAGAYRGMVTDPLGALVPFLLPAIIALSLYGLPLAVKFLWTWVKRGPRSALRPQILWSSFHWPFRSPEQHLGQPAILGVALLMGLFVSQALLPASADYNFPIEAETSPVPEAGEPSLLAATPIVVEQQEAPKAIANSEPSKVVISGADYNYTYTVNGQARRIRGIGYNVMYSHLSGTERAARYDSDFDLMRAAGVSTILGWEREQFDELTLEKAQEYGLGVVLPYYLPRDGEYSDRVYQQKIEQDVKEWVGRFKKYPALRMWGIGNEVIHGMGKNPDAPRPRAFAQFYVKLADMVHTLDPDHPVTYRDAEDLYISPIRDAFNKDGVRRSWFVYGVNFFTNRICEALDNWPKRALDTPLMVSEFAPTGLSPEDRPKGYVKMLRCIAKQKASVLGAFAYVWTTNGPEAIDRVMGLVTADGQPVDRSLSSLGRAYRHNLDLNEEVFRATE